MLRLLLANNDLLYNTADNNNLNAQRCVVHLMDCGSADKTANCSGSESPRSALLSVIDWPIALGQWSMRSDGDSCVSDAVYTRSIYWSQQTTGEKLSDDSVQPRTVVRGVDPMCFSGSGLEHSNSRFESILLISNHSSFRVLFDKIASVYFIWKIYLYFITGNGQPRKTALCQLYRHPSFPIKQELKVTLLAVRLKIKPTCR